jgi:hypothetical protein
VARLAELDAIMRRADARAGAIQAAECRVARHSRRLKAVK